MIKIHLQQLLERESHTCAELSRITGIPYSFLLRMKKGKVKYIRYEYLETPCKVLQCKPSDLIVYTRTK